MHMHICTEHNNQGFGFEMTLSTTQSRHACGGGGGRCRHTLHRRCLADFTGDFMSRSHLDFLQRNPMCLAVLLRNEPTKTVTHPPFKKFCPGNPQENSPQNIPWV